jgi:glycosyltransferase involved in cell wall biosynthesis
MSGYAGMALPKAMAQLDVDVHVVAGNLNVYFNYPNYQVTYYDLLGPAVTPCGVQEVNGFILHRLSHQIIGGHVRLKGLYGTLRELRPQVLQTWSAISLIPLEAAIWSSVLGYKLFTAQHTHASVFPAAAKRKLKADERLKNFILRYAHGRIIAARTTKCYPTAPDCQEIAVRFLGVPGTKCALRPLGVDTELFHPIADSEQENERRRMRAEFGFRDTDIVCLYSGRLAQDKNPLCLAQAVQGLRCAERPFRALFIGDGIQKADIIKCRGCVVHDFVNYTELPAYYRMADIGVWPTQESTSMLDAAAIGLPIVVSDQIQAHERVEGSGLTYRENDLQDLIATLNLLEDAGERLRLGQAGAAKMKSQFSWLAIARRTLKDFEQALQHKSN